MIEHIDLKVRDATIDVARSGHGPPLVLPVGDDIGGAVMRSLVRMTPTVCSAGSIPAS